MNAGLLTSFIVAGILIVSIITMNNSVSNNSSELTLTQFTRERMATVSKMMADDIQKIGYNRTGKTEKMLKIGNGHKIKFHSNIDNSDDGTVEEVTWELTDEEVTSTSNPNDHILKRTVEYEDGSLDETPITLGVTEFRIAYYNDYGVPLSDSLNTPIDDADIRDEVKQFYIEIKLESPEKIYTGRNSSGRYVTSVWEKRFSPPNLEETEE
ncbi:MAG: hypothetical protein ACQEST_12890 [Bacteroidota bacterium]